VRGFLNGATSWQAYVASILYYKNTMPNTEERFFAATLRDDLVTIDLHQYASAAEALEQLHRELFLVYERGEAVCRVVHGIGEGILAEKVHAELDSAGIVVARRDEEHGGACMVLL